MLTRRHIRIKVLQSIYAFYQARQEDLTAQEKFLLLSLDQMLELYVLMLQTLVATRDHAKNYHSKLQQKHLATERDKNPSLNFINNRVVALIASNPAFNTYLGNKKLDYWKDDDEYIGLLFKELRTKDWYEEYLELNDCSIADDRKLLLKFYKEVIAPNDKLYEYLEDKRLTWMDDFPLVNTAIVRTLEQLNNKNSSSLLMPELYKHPDDREFARKLLRKVILNNEELIGQVDVKHPTGTRTALPMSI